MKTYIQCVVGLSLALGLLAGCAVVQPPEAARIAGLQGQVHGGQQPVSGAAMQLYAVGTSGDGSAATALLTTTVLTDANGNFTLTGDYTCPSASSLVYLVAAGGNPGLGAGQNNPQLVLVTALGQCGNLTPSTFIVVNELTTVAAVYALAPYMTSAAAVGSATSDEASLANAFALASELVNPGSGLAPGINVPTGTTVPVAQINTIADILATCINSPGGASGDGSACGQFFLLTTPAGGTAPTNAVTAVLYLANNPTLNTGALYNLATPAAPFQPVDAVAPPDLSIRLTMPSGLTVSPTNLNFGNVATSIPSAPQTVTLSNTGTTSVQISSVGFSGANASAFSLSSSVASTCSVMQIDPGQSCTYQVVFAPQSQVPLSGYFVINNNSSNPSAAVSLSGTWVPAPVAGPVTLSPSSMTFALYGTPQTATLTNYGNTPLSIYSITFTTQHTGSYVFFSETDNCGGSVPAQSICIITISSASVDPYTPPSAALTPQLVIYDSASPAQQFLDLGYSNQNGNFFMVDIYGTTFTPQAANPIASLPFGSWAVGTTYELGFGYTASGTATISGANASDFSFRVQGNYVSSETCPGAGCTLYVYFTPTGVGPRTATVTIPNFGSLPLTGTGLPPGDSLAVAANPNFLALPNSHVVFSNSPYVFPAQSLGTTIGSPNFTLVNNGSTTQMLPQGLLPVTGPNASDFQVAAECPVQSWPPGTVCQFSIISTPTSVGMHSATIGGLFTVSGLVLEPTPTVNPTSLTFATTALGTMSASQAVAVSTYGNHGISASVSGPFVLTQATSCASTPCSISVAFSPTAVGAATGNLTITDTTTNLSTTVSLSGTGGQFGAGLSPSSLTFATRSVGSTLIAQTVTVNNTGSLPLNVTNLLLAGADPGDYIIVNNYCTSAVSVGGYCTFTVSFSPTAVGTRTATVQVYSNAPTSPDVVMLTGTGQ